MKLQDGEEILHEMKPEASILGIWFVTKCLGFAFLGAFLSFWASGFFGGMFCATTGSNSVSPITTGLRLAPVVGITFLVLALLYCSALRKTYHYWITNMRCVFHGGIIRRVERSVPYHKVTDVEMSQNIVERALNISSINVFTPGTASMQQGGFGQQRAEIRFEGLVDSETPTETINKMVRQVRSTGE